MSSFQEAQATPDILFVSPKSSLRIADLFRCVPDESAPDLDQAFVQGVRHNQVGIAVKLVFGLMRCGSTGLEERSKSEARFGLDFLIVLLRIFSKTRNRDLIVADQ